MNVIHFILFYGHISLFSSSVRFTSSDDETEMKFTHFRICQGLPSTKLPGTNQIQFKHFPSQSSNQILIYYASFSLHRKKNYIDQIEKMCKNNGKLIVHIPGVHFEIPKIPMCRRSSLCLPSTFSSFPCSMSFIPCNDGDRANVVNNKSFLYRHTAR